MRIGSLLAAATVAFSAAGPALADITVLQGPFGGPLTNVVLDEGALDIFVDGEIGPGGTPVLFVGGENLNVQGQSIEAANGNLEVLLYTLVNPALGFTATAFNLNAVADSQVSIQAFDQFGTSFGGVFDLDAGGQNFFHILATDNQLIQRVVITSLAGLADVSQVRIGDIFATPIPEPMAWSMMILGFGGVGAMLRSRRARLGAATA